MKRLCMQSGSQMLKDPRAKEGHRQVLLVGLKSFNRELTQSWAVGQKMDPCAVHLPDHRSYLPLGNRSTAPKRMQDDGTEERLQIPGGSGTTVG